MVSDRSGRPLTLRRRLGDVAEQSAVDALRTRGWTVLARQVRVGRDEIDVVAIEPGPPAVLVAVEVRGRSTARFGRQEERVDPAKVRRCYRAAMALVASGRLPDGRPLPVGLGWRVDLLSVDLPEGRIRHLRGIIPS